MNKFQKELFDSAWYLNVILKARQLGVTTFIDILFLDSVLFSKDKHAAIIAHTKEDAEVIFSTKIKFPFDNLPDWLKSSFQVSQDTLRELKFANGSSIRVATSVRSGTLQFLHISEFGYTCAKFPEKAQEIISGSLNTVHSGQLVYIESTAKGRDGHFYDLCMRAMDLKKHGELGLMDYKFFFFPWHDNPEYSIPSGTFIDQSLQDYFKHVEVECSKNLSPGQAYWYAKKLEVLGEEMKAEYPSYPEEAFKASMEGSYYGRLIDQSWAEGRITNVPYDPRLYVDTYWDLGIGDDNAIIFTQNFNQEVRIIDCYSSTGEGLSHYAKVLQQKGYVYGSHWAPHDIEVRELGTGKSRKEHARNLGINFRVAKKLPLDDGIEAGRMLLPRVWIDKNKGDKFIKAISHYKKEWDEVNATFKNRPLHDWSSHYADAYRVLAVSNLGGGTQWLSREKQGQEESGPFNRFGVLAEF